MAPPATICVHVASEVEGTTLPVGVAYVNRRGAQTTVNLTYATDYLADSRAYPVSPDLPLSQSRHSTDGLPGAFADSAPDRPWPSPPPPPRICHAQGVTTSLTGANAPVQ